MNKGFYDFSKPNAISAKSASHAEFATSASYAISASYLIGGISINTGSLVTTSSFNSYTGSNLSQFAGTSSFSTSSSFAVSSSRAVSASFATSSSLAQTASYVLQAVSASYSNTASFAPNYQLTSGTGSMLLPYVLTSSTSSMTVLSASFAISSSRAVSASYSNTASYATVAGNGGVTQILAGTNVNISPTNGLGNVTITSFGTNLYNTATGSYGSFYDTGSVSAASATNIYSMSLSTTDISNGVFVSSSNGDNTKVKFINAGVYNIQFSAQFSNSDNSIQDVVVWVKKNGTDVVDSSGTVGIPPFKAGSSGQVIASWNYYLNLSANDYVQLCWHVEQANVVTLETIAAGTSPTHPRTPSLILTAQRVDTFLSNTGSFSGSFTGTFSGSLFGTSSWATNAINSNTASYILQAISASFATSASNSLTASYVLNAVSSSQSQNAQTASYVLQAISSSFASTASFAPNYQLTSGTGSMLAPYVLTSQTSSMSVLSASFASTASFAQGGNGSFTGSFSGSGANLNSIPTTAIVGNFTQIATGSVTASVTPTQFSVVSGSMTEFLVTGTGATIGSAITDTHRVTGSLLVTGSNTVIGPKIITGSLTVTGPNTATSGPTYPIVNTSSFSPTTGNGTYAGIYEGSTINQTSGSTSGIARGIYINPTVNSASAYDYRAFESTNGRVIITDNLGAVGSSSIASYNPAVDIYQTWNNAKNTYQSTFRVNTWEINADTNSSLLQLTISSSAQSLNPGYVPVFTVNRLGNIYLGANLQSPSVGTANPVSPYGGATLGKALLLRHYLTSEAGYGIIMNAVTSFRTNTGTATDNGTLRTMDTFAPTAGTATYNNVTCGLVVSQSGTATGITRGLYVSPTLTNAVDYRAIEFTNNSGFGIYQAGSAKNSLFGDLLLGTNNTGSTAAGKLQIIGSSATTGNALVVSNSTPTNLLTVQNNGQVILNTPTVILAASQSAFIISQSISQSAVVGASVYGLNLVPTFFATTGSQTEIALRVAPTFLTSSAVATSGSNIIADFGSLGTGTQFTVNDTISGSIYLVNDVSGLPIIEANSNWDVNIYDYPTKVLQKTGSQIIINGTLKATGSFILPLSQSTSPQIGSAYWSGSFLFVHNGTRYMSASFF